jgi:hypothetical protein
MMKKLGEAYIMTAARLTRIFELFEVQQQPGLEKTRVFKKNQTSGFLKYLFAHKREFLGFQFQEYFSAF